MRAGGVRGHRANVAIAGPASGPPLRVLLISTYELGHQPLHVASPAAALRRAGHDPRCLDISIERLDAAAIDACDAVAFSVPMHTAMRLAMRAAQVVRAQRPDLPICFYGLYAPVSRDLTVGRLADRVIAGEYEPGLVAWVAALARGGSRDSGADDPLIQLGRGDFEVPARDLLPALDRYAHLALGGEERAVGYVEVSHGCVHECRHCPIPAVYGGRIRIVSVDTVLGDIEQLVSMGARHITFGDPDFLNGRRHSLAVARAMHERFPELTFDCTVKVEHILEHADVWPQLAEHGCLFVVSALECVNDEILERLDKGHTTDDARAAIALVRQHGIELRPSFMPFTPWTTIGDLRALLAFVAENDLIDNVDPIQYSIRLLLPEGSLLADHADMLPHLDGYDRERLSYRWHAADPEVDELQARLAALGEGSLAAGEPSAATFTSICDTVGIERAQIPVGSIEGRPRLTEPWFC
ncbi:MAG: CUAEP/CCAEP-tail radical SAM protein [Thermoleophilaceae bacterium]